MKIETAYHSSHMKAVAKGVSVSLGELEKPPKISRPTEMYSSVTSKRVDGDLTAHCWVDNLVSPVRFTEALVEMAFGDFKSSALVNSSTSAIQEIVEIGPHSALRKRYKGDLSSSYRRFPIPWLLFCAESQLSRNRNNPGYYR